MGPDAWATRLRGMRRPRLNRGPACIASHEDRPRAHVMKRFLLTLVLGSLFATLGEFLFCVLVRQSLPDYLFTLAAYPAILALTYFPLRWIERRMPSELAADMAVYALAGMLGLAMGGFVIGNSPWANPERNDLGMFGYW